MSKDLESKKIHAKDKKVWQPLHLIVNIFLIDFSSVTFTYLNGNAADIKKSDITAYFFKRG